MKMLAHGDRDELSSFPPPIIPYSTQDLPKTPADTPNTYIDPETFDYDGPFGLGDLGSVDSSPSAMVIELQRLIDGVGPVTAPDGKLVEPQAPAPAPAPEDGRPSGSGPDADMQEQEVNRNIAHARLIPFKLAIEQDLAGGFTSTETLGSRISSAIQEMIRVEYGKPSPCVPIYGKDSIRAHNERNWMVSEHWMVSERDPYRLWSVVRFTGPDSKGKKAQQYEADGEERSKSKSRKPHQPCWKETSMTGMRAAFPLLGGTSSYVGVKKTLELEDDGDGNRWRAHEYTPLLPPHDDPSKLVLADLSLRFAYKVDEPPSSNSKRPRPEPDEYGRSNGNNGPRISDVWEHMTRIYIKVATDNAVDGSSKRKKNPYKLMFAICNHCDKVFNADPKNGTNNQLKHLANCKCDCTQTQQVARTKSKTTLVG